MTTSAVFRRCRCGGRTFRIAPTGQAFCSLCGDLGGDQAITGLIEAFSTEEWEDLFAATEGRCRMLEGSIRRSGQQIEIQDWLKRLAVSQTLRDKVKQFVPTLAPKLKKRKP